MSRTRSYCLASAEGIACRRALGSGGAGAALCEEHAAIETHNKPAASPMSRDEDVPVRGPNSPHRHRKIMLRRPNQRDHPANHAPSQEQIQQEDRQDVTLAARQRNNRRQKIHHETEADKWEKEKRQRMHRRTSLQ